MLLQGTGATFTASRITEDLIKHKRLGVNCQMDIPYFLPGFHAGDKRQQLGDFLLPRCRPSVPMPCEVRACEHPRHVPVKMFGHQVVHSQDGAQAWFTHERYQDQYSLGQGGVLIQVPSMHVVDEKAGEERCDLMRRGGPVQDQRDHVGLDRVHELGQLHLDLELPVQDDQVLEGVDCVEEQGEWRVWLRPLLVESEESEIGSASVSFLHIEGKGLKSRFSKSCAHLK